MGYDFTGFLGRSDEVIDWLMTEYSLIQTGKITPSILDGVSVEVFGSKQKIAHISTITIEDPKTIKIVLYDQTNLQLVENAIRNQSQMSVSVGESSIRVIAPEMTGDRREMMSKLVKEKAEEAKQSVRGDREKEMNNLKKQKEDKTISEDEFFTYKEELQKKVDDINKKIDDTQSKKLEDLKV